MKVIEFVEKYKQNPRIDIAKELEVKQYTGIAFKREMMKLILDNCTQIVDGEVRIDSVERYILFTIAVIAMHTNLDFVNEEDSEEHGAMDDYDLLCESGLLIKIIDTFKEDYASCQEVLNMMTADKMQESVTIENKINQLIDEIQNILSNAINNLTENIDLGKLLGDESIDISRLLEIAKLVK